MLYVAAALPALLATIVITTKWWSPQSDWADELLHVVDVGGSHTPLVGVYSRDGWSHPGPLLFYALAPFYRLLGQRGLLVGTGVINVASLVGAVAVARRRATDWAAPLGALAGLALCASLTPSLLVNSWNPYVAVLPFFAMVVCAWAVIDGDTRMAPWMVLTGSFSVQCHVGYAVLVGTVWLATFACWVASRRRSVGLSDHPAPKRSTLVAVVLVGAACWAPPILQQLTGHPGNLSAMAKFLLHSDEPRFGWSGAEKSMSFDLSPHVPWINGRDTGAGVLLASSNPLIGLTVFALVVALGVLAWRLGRRSAARLAFVSALIIVAGTFSIAQIMGPAVSYLVRWSWVIAAVTWVSIALSSISCVEALAHRRTRRASDDHARPDALLASATSDRWGVRLASGLAVILVALLLAPSAVQASVPHPRRSQTVHTLATAIAPHLDRHDTYLIKWFDRNWVAGINTGVTAELSIDGYHVLESPNAWRSLGAHRVLAKGAVPDFVITGYSVDLLANDWRPAPGQRVIARASATTKAEDRRKAELEVELRRIYLELLAVPRERWNHPTPDLRRLRARNLARQKEYDDLVALGSSFVVVIEPGQRG
jgi:hypothetical protein